MKGTSPSRAGRAVAATGNKVPRWEVQSLINSLMKRKSITIVTVGIDLAKNVFAVHGVDATGKPVLIRPSVARSRLAELMAPPSAKPSRHPTCALFPPARWMVWSGLNTRNLRCYIFNSYSRISDEG